MRRKLLSILALLCLYVTSVWAAQEIRFNGTYGNAFDAGTVLLTVNGTPTIPDATEHKVSNVTAGTPVVFSANQGYQFKSVVVTQDGASGGTNIATLNAASTEATFTMPDGPVTVQYSLARDITYNVDGPYVFINGVISYSISIVKDASGQYHLPNGCMFAAVDNLDQKNPVYLNNGGLNYSFKKKVGDQYEAVNTETDLVPGIWRLEAESNPNQPYVGTIYGPDVTLTESSGTSFGYNVILTGDINDPANWIVSPNTDLKSGDKVTVSYNGSNTITGVTVTLVPAGTDVAVTKTADKNEWTFTMPEGSVHFAASYEGGGTPQPTTYSVGLLGNFSSQEDCNQWVISPQFGLNGGETVTVTYNGSNTVKSISVRLMPDGTTVIPSTKAADKNEWTFTMPNGNVEVNVEYEGGSSQPTTVIYTTTVTKDYVQNWSGDETALTPSDLPGFKSISEAEAQAWTDASSSGETVLIYDFSYEPTTEGGTNIWAHVAHWIDGVFQFTESRLYLHKTLYKLLVIDNKQVFYPNGGTPQPTTYSVGLLGNFTGQEEYNKWVISPQFGLNGGETVTVNYNGSNTVKSISVRLMPDGTTVIPSTKAADKNEWTFTMPNGNVEVNVEYEGGSSQPQLNTCTLSFASSNNNWGTVEIDKYEGSLPSGVTENTDGTYSVVEGTYITLKAVAKTGYYIAGWSNNAQVYEGQEISYNPIQVYCDTTLIATFAEKVLQLYVYGHTNPNTIDEGKATLKIDGVETIPTQGKVEGLKVGTKVTLTAAHGYKVKYVSAGYNIKFTPANTAANWSNVSCYIFNNEYDQSSWPGMQMYKNDGNNYWEIWINYNYPPSNIIFNDGTTNESDWELHQTADLPFASGKAYNKNGDDFGTYDINENLAVTYNADRTEASFDMPGGDIGIAYVIVRDLTVGDVDVDVLINQQPATNIPIVKDGNGHYQLDGYWQFVATDKLDADNPITLNNGELIYTLKKKVDDQYVVVNTDTDLEPGTWRLEAEGNTINYNGIYAGYEGTVYGSDLTLYKSTWTVAGSSDIFGSYWDVTDTSNDMTTEDDIIYTLTKKGVQLEAGVTYEYKVAKNHSWDVNYGDYGIQDGPNVILTVPETGTYDLTFTFSANTHILSKPSGLAYEQSEQDYCIGFPAHPQTLVNPYNVPVTYSSSNTDIVTVNETTGELTLLKTGSTTITASFNGNNEFWAGSASYQINVKAPVTVTVASNDEQMGKVEALSKESTVLWEGNQELAWDSYSLNIPAEDMAAIPAGSEIHVYYTVTNNSSYMYFVTQWWNEISEPINPTSSTPNPHVFVIDENDKDIMDIHGGLSLLGEGCSIQKVVAVKNPGVVATEIAGVYSVIPNTLVTIKATPAKAHYLKSWSNDAEVNAEGTQTIIVGDADLTITANFAHGYEVTVAPGEYATLYTDMAVATEDADAELYTISSVTDTEAVLSEAIKVAPKETPLLVYNKGTEAKTFLLMPTEDEPDNVTPAKEFKGTLTAGQIAASTTSVNNYALNGKQFVWVKYAINIGANKCWLQIGEQPAASRTRTRSIVGGGDATGIDSVDSGQLTDDSYYDLQGRKVAKPNGKGIYIHNGQKVVLK